MNARSSAIAAALALATASTALGQQAAALGSPQGAADTSRVRLEGDVRRLFARAVRQRVGLSEDQMQRLAPIASRFEQRRRALQTEERDARLQLRSALTGSAPADQAKVDGLLQRMVDVQKRRVQVLEDEQRELAGIMTPVQRARYMALQEQVRRRLELMRQRRMQARDDDLDAPARPRIAPRRRP